MEVKFGKRFQKDIDIINDADIITAIHSVILEVEKAKDIRQIKIYKKLKKSKTAFAIRIGVYRMGIYIENNVVEFSRFLPRDKIYKFFPYK